MSNFDFLEEKFPSLANFGRLAEKYLYTDANSCLIKLGMLGENIVNLIFEYDRISHPLEDTAVNRIRKLRQEDLIDEDLESILHQLRKKRNEAVYADNSSRSDALDLLPMAYSLAVWFYQTYGDGNYTPAEFIMPSGTELGATNSSPDIASTSSGSTNADEAGSNNSTESKEAEADLENQLVEESVQTAKQAQAIPLADRKKASRKAANQRPKSEAETRVLIDEQLRKVGWEADTRNLRYSKGTRPEKGRNLAIAEWPTDSQIGTKGAVDYALFIGEKMVATVEAKAIYKNIPSVIDYQCDDYSSMIREKDGKYEISQWGKYKVPFTFATNGRPYIEQYAEACGIWFRDYRKPTNIPRPLMGWISPQGMIERLQNDHEASIKRLERLPYDFMTDKDGLSLRYYQINAIKATEAALEKGQDRILLAMATGTGKTRTVLGMIYRFLKTGRFRRILFLVDRNSLGIQAEDVFTEVKLERLMTLDHLYNLKTLDDTGIDPETRVQIATVQSMVRRILYNESDTMPSVSDYDLLIADEAHRGYILDREMTDEQSLYSDQKDYQSKYRCVIDYFDAVKIGLTATPALQTAQIFGNPVFQYSYREAVIDGYLVDHDAPHHLETKLTREGIHYRKGDHFPVYDPKTGTIENDAELEDETLDFDVEEFNRQVITRPFNEAVLREISRDIDPEGEEKTLIYAANDAHADMIVSILRDIYSEQGVSPDAVLKITGKTADGNKKKVEAAIKRFQNEHYPTIAVTVDLLTTGIDVPQITNLVFLRRVKSRILFEQMLGRATRLCPEIHKTHFNIYDAVGVYDALEPFNTMKPVVANPNVSVLKLADSILDAQTDDDQQIQSDRDQIVAKLRRREKNITPEAMKQFEILAGMSLSEFERKLSKAEPAKVKTLVKEAHAALVELSNKFRTRSGKVVISNKEDELLEHSRGYGKDDQNPEDYLESFSEFIRTNLNEIAALRIICTKPSDLTRESLKKLRVTLDSHGYTEQQLDSAVHQMTNEEIAADIISLVRRYAIGSPLVSHEERIHRAVRKLKQAHHFSKIEENWIDRIEKYLIEESVINMGIFDEDSRFKSQGGYQRINKIFGNDLRGVITELNTYLYEDKGDKTA